MARPVCDRESVIPPKTAGTQTLTQREFNDYCGKKFMPMDVFIKVDPSIRHALKKCGVILHDFKTK